MRGRLVERSTDDGGGAGFLPSPPPVAGFGNGEIRSLRTVRVANTLKTDSSVVCFGADM